MRAIFSNFFLGTIFLIGISRADIILNKEDGRPGKEIGETVTLLYRYLKSHDGAVPQNWSDVWDAKEVANSYNSLVGRPLLHQKIAFVDPSSQLTADGSGTRILAITRAVVPRPFGSKNGDDELEWVGHRLIVFLAHDGSLKLGSVDSERPLRGVDLNKLTLLPPNLTNIQIAETVSELVNGIGLNEKQLQWAFGAEELEKAKDSGILDKTSLWFVNESLRSGGPTNSAASFSESATSIPKSLGTALPASKFSIFPLGVVAVAIAVVVVFFLFRRGLSSKEKERK